MNVMNLDILKTQEEVKNVIEYYNVVEDMDPVIREGWESN